MLAQFKQNKRTQKLVNFSPSKWTSIRFSFGLVILATLLMSSLAEKTDADEAASPIDLSILRINAPMAAPPANMPPFPDRVDLPVSLSKESLQEQPDQWSRPQSQNNDESNSLGTGSQAHAEIAKKYLADAKVVDAFRELKKAVELNNWKSGDSFNASTCHRMLADILLEYALKAKDSGRGTKGMQRLLNSYIEYRQAVFLNPDDREAKAGLVNATDKIVEIGPTFNNLMALASANLLIGNSKAAAAYYARCLELAPINTTIPEEKTSAVARELAALQGKDELSNKNASGAYEPHALAKYNQTDKSIAVHEDEAPETIKVSPFGTTNYYVDSVRKQLADEWRLSKFQTNNFPAVAFSVDNNGNITELRITKSSGSQAIDEDALNVVRRVAPFPNAPQNLSEITFRFDDKGSAPDLTNYMRQLRRKIRHKWQPPQDMQEDHVVVSFRVHRDGSVDNSVMKQASASELRNQACLKAISDGAPFPHFPEGAPESEEVLFHFDHAVESPGSH